MSQPPKGSPVRAVPAKPASAQPVRPPAAAETVAKQVGERPAPKGPAQKGPAQPVAQPTVAVAAPARPARAKRRHWFLIFSFLVVAVTPPAVAAWYLWTRAADQYASYFAFSVRSEEQSPAVELLGGITELSGASSSDTDILFSFLSSQELVAKVNERIDLAAIWSRVPVSQDPVFSYDSDGTIEDLVAHWDRQVQIIYDSGTRLMEVRVLAFEAQDAQAIARAMLDESSATINELSAIAREDAIRYSREELETAAGRLRDARQELTRFRNRTQIVDPSFDTQNQMGVLVTLQQQLADALIELDLLVDTARSDDPRVDQANRRVAVIRSRIEAERRNLGLGGSDGEDIVFADLVGEYEGLIVDREFAEVAYTSALATYDAALAEARRQSRYLAAHVQPTLAQRADYPERPRITLLVVLFSILSWGILCLVYYSLRDRS